MIAARKVSSVILVLFACCAVAHATDDPDTEIARRRFSTGAALYEAGRYEEAVAEFEAARRVRPSPAFDYNIARSYDRLERVDEAISAYERWIASAPADDGGARSRLAVLRAQRGGTVTRGAEGVLTVTARPRSTRYAVAAPASVGVIALAALAAGGALYGVSGARYDQLTADGCGARLACDESRWGATQRMERAGIGLLVAGGVLAAADIGLWAAWRRR